MDSKLTRHGARLLEDKMGTLTFVCPATGMEVSTGIEMDLATLSELELAKIYCPRCRQSHHMTGIQYWLTPLSDLEITQEEPQAA